MEHARREGGLVGVPGPDPVRAALDDRQIRARLLRVTRKIALSVPDAEDAFQDAVVQALVHADRFRSDALVSTWLHRIVVNAALMGRRRSAVWTRRTAHVRLERDGRASIFADEGESVGAAELPDAGPSPEQILSDREQRERLRIAIAQLPARARRTVDAFLLAQTIEQDVESVPVDGREDDPANQTVRGAGEAADAGDAGGAVGPGRPVTSNAIRARLSRARARLRDLVGAMELAMPGTA
jgi:RNA polymerase sigma factor (sigma-70 family)